MFSGRKAAKRFSLLLLEEEEDYVQDWVVSCKWPSNVSGAWSAGRPIEGRIRLCTKSLFFDPDDIRIPIVRLPFAGVQSLTTGGGPGACFTLATNSLTKMKANMQEAPYIFEKGTVSQWVFTLLYAPLTAVQPIFKQLMEANKLPKPQRTEALEAFVSSREQGVVFDTSRLVDFSERILLQVVATQLTPLVRERGHLVITSTRLYFQPLYNVSGDTPVKSHPLAGIAAIARRRSCLRPLGLELFFVRPSDTRAARAMPQQQQAAGDVPAGPGSSSSGNLSRGVFGAAAVSTASSQLSDLELMVGGQVWDGPSAFFAFRNEDEREAVAAKLSSNPELGSAVAKMLQRAGSPTTAHVTVHSHLLEAQGGWLHRITAAWQAARISNFDYLMYLNLAAGRSFNDLAQWPVFPWVISNWVTSKLDLCDPSHFRDLSKPIGALNPVRLAEFKKRYNEMPHDSFDENFIPPFLFGTHYSTPGYVMYWLLRAAPAHMLRLQNGRFDAPDRLFHSMQESWESVLNSSTDVKELLPEFYLPGGGWLVNGQRLPLGVRQNGQAVNDVQLPPWAKDPEHFLAMHRAALESPPVSKQLHQWIDLIFGYKQRGPAAEAADNVFYHLTYEGAVDVSQVKDPIELKALETQINEFGQTPRQLFTQPHPPRGVIPGPADPATIFNSLVSTSEPPAMSPTAAAVASSGTVASGNDTSYRALALTLIHAVSQAVTMDVPEPQRQETLDRSSSVRDVSKPADVVAKTGNGEGTGEGTLHQLGNSLGNAAGVVSNAAGSVLSGLLKLGRYQSKSGALQHASSSNLAKSGDLGETVTPTASGDGATMLDDSMQPKTPPAMSAKPQGAGLAADSIPENTPFDISPGLLDELPDLGSILNEANYPSAAIDHSSEHTQGVQMQAPTVASQAASYKLITDGWGSGLPDLLAGCDKPDGRMSSVVVQATRGCSITGVYSWGRKEEGHQYVYCTCADGLLKVLQIHQAEESSFSPGYTAFRSQQFDEDLLCMGVVHGLAIASHSFGFNNRSSYHPLILAGSHNQKVYAYSVEQGQLLGSFEAHDDAVCAIALPLPAIPSTPLQPPHRFYTASWDCTIKSWSLGDKSVPWSWAAASLAPQPEACWDLGEGVWALTAGVEGSNLLVAGTEEGKVIACDVRASRPVWSVSAAQDYVGGIAIAPCGRHVTVGTADGALTLLDVRLTGSRLATAKIDAPIRCVIADSRLALAGSESGHVCLWDTGLLSASETAPVNDNPPAPDGQYRPWAPVSNTEAVESSGHKDSRYQASGSRVIDSMAPVTALSVTAYRQAISANGPSSDCNLGVAVGREDGTIVVSGL